MNQKNIEEKIRNKSLKIGILGLGYVGLPLAMTYNKKGFQVFGYDIDNNKINQLSNNKNYILDIDDKSLFKSIKNKTFIPSNDENVLKKCDVIFICVPTPITKNRVPDVSYIKSSINIIINNFNNGVTIILKSTTYPGTTEEIIMNTLTRNGKEIDKDYFLAFSPERIDPGNKTWNSDNTPIVLGGVTKESTQISEIILKSVIPQVHTVSNVKVAEMEKLLENIFRSVNIALVNELAQMCDRMGNINVWEVINAAATKPFGYMPFNPGPGIGGHCILVDPYYLSYCAKGYDFHSEFIELAAKTNENMPHYVVDEIIKVLLKNSSNMYKAKILFLGVAFKKNVGDVRNSPALKIIELLENIGFKNIYFYDPYVSNCFINGSDCKSISNLQNIDKFDCCIITTDHDDFDYELIFNKSNLIFDTRNTMKDKKHNKKYFLLGDGQK